MSLGLGLHSSRTQTARCGFDAGLLYVSYEQALVFWFACRLLRVDAFLVLVSSRAAQACWMVAGTYYRDRSYIGK